jgi:hypothetical protein
MEVKDQLHVMAASISGKEPPVSFEYEARCAPQPGWTLASAGN